MDEKSDIRILRSDRLIKPQTISSTKSDDVITPLSNDGYERRARRMGVTVNSEQNNISASESGRSSDSSIPSTSSFIKSYSSESLLAKNRKYIEKRPQTLDLTESFNQWNEKNANGKNIRRSTRDIKRPKFDDEIVDSITGKVGMRRSRGSNDIEDDYLSESPGPNFNAKKRGSISSPTKSVVMSILAAAGGKIKEAESSLKETKINKFSPPKAIIITEPSNSFKLDSDKINSLNRNGHDIQRRRRIKDNRLQIKQKPALLTYSNPIHQGIVDEIFKKWEVEDDIMLMAGIHHLCDLQSVLAQCKFSKRFTLNDLDERWYLMLYDDQASVMINKRISEQSKNVVQRIYQNLPFIAEEDRILQNFGSSFEGIEPTLQDTDKLLKTNKSIFCLWRTGNSLLERYKYLQKHNLIVKKDEKTGKIPCRNGLNPMHEEIEQNIDFCNLVQKDVPIDVDTAPRDMAEAEKQYLETKKAPHEAIAGTNLSPQMPSNVLAQLRGCCVSFNILTKLVIIGRSTEKYAVDVNLNYEGPCQRVSRSQAVLKLNDNDDFLIFNIGRNPIFVDKKVLQPNQKTVLSSNTTLEFGIISLLFLRNETALKPKNFQPESTKVFTEPITL